MINRINLMIILGLGIVLFSLVAIAATTPILAPEAYYGAITGAGSGLTITAKIGTTTVGTYTLVKNNYYGNASAASSDGKLIVCAAGENGCTSGATITFSASSGSISTTSTFTPGGITNLALSYTAPSAPGAGAGAGSSPGGAAISKPSVTLTPVTDTTTINLLKRTLPKGWTNVKYVQYGDAVSKTQTASISIIDNALTHATSQKAISVLQNLRNKIQSGEVSSVTATVTLTVYKVQNKDTGDEVYRSKIDITFTAPNDMENVEIVEVVPKTVASSADDLIFSGAQPVILQSDPILQWVIDKISKGETKSFTYVVKKQLSKIESTTLSAGKTIEVEEPVVEEIPPEEKPEIKPPVKKLPVTGIIIIVAIVIIGLIIYLVMTRKKRE